MSYQVYQCRKCGSFNQDTAGCCIKCGENVPLQYQQCYTSKTRSTEVTQDKQEYIRCPHCFKIINKE